MVKVNRQFLMLFWLLSSIYDCKWSVWGTRCCNILYHKTKKSLCRVIRNNPLQNHWSIFLRGILLCNSLPQKLSTLCYKLALLTFMHSFKIVVCRGFSKDVWCQQLMFGGLYIRKYNHFYVATFPIKEKAIIVKFDICFNKVYVTPDEPTSHWTSDWWITM